MDNIGSDGLIHLTTAKWTNLSRINLGKNITIKRETTYKVKGASIWRGQVGNSLNLISVIII